MTQAETFLRAMVLPALSACCKKLREEGYDVEVRDALHKKSNSNAKIVCHHTDLRMSSSLSISMSNDSELYATQLIAEKNDGRVGGLPCYYFVQDSWSKSQVRTMDMEDLCRRFVRNCLEQL